MSSMLKRAIVRTLSYSDIFDYPLKLSEIRKYLIGYILPSENWQSKLKKTIKSIPFIREKDGFYFIKGRQKIIAWRIEKEKISLKKIPHAQKIAKLLCLIPPVKAVAVTGNLALFDSQKKDDIDFLIVSGRNRIWLTRFLCVLLLKIIGVYRDPDEIDVADKICLNMFLDEDHLLLPVKERDLYSAHEIIQMKPLISKCRHENILLVKNPWVKKFLPNAFSKNKGVHRKSSFIP